MKILDRIKEKEEFILASCNGNKSCGLCKVKVLNAPISKEEEILLTREELDNNIRLACIQEYKDDNYEIVQSQIEILDNLKTDADFYIQEGKAILIDIGTTTIVMKWIDLTSAKQIKSESFLNPQAVYGADVISRISYKDYHLLHDILINSFKEKINDDIKKIYICGNTTMTNLFLDQDVSSLGHLPFNVPIKDKQNTKLFNVETFVYPSISAFVGGDIVSGILYCGMDEKTEKTMLVDLGTNGEIAIGNKDEILTCSTSAGPSFEAVGISFGTPSIEGAISEINIDDTNNVSYKTIGNTKALSICGSGLISIVANLRRKNLISNTGKFINKEDKYYLTKDIYITQKDIQTFLLAKAAIQTGINVLLNKNNVSKIYIAGGLGNSIKIADLITLKMLPNNVEIEIIGNSAINGLYKHLVNNLDSRIDNIINISKNIDLASLDNFNDIYIDSLYI